MEDAKQGLASNFRIQMPGQRIRPEAEIRCLSSFCIRRLLKSLVSVAAGMLFFAASARPGAIIPGSLSGTLGPTDDGSSGEVPLGIGGPGGIDLLGTAATSVFVNNNGNVTFISALGGFIPDGLAAGVGVPIIAPFFADVDTTGPGSGVTTYGNLSVGGRTAFAVDWIDVGFYPGQTDKLNSFQLLLIDRSDTGAGNFDIEFNYDRVRWETGRLDGGLDGLGGISASAGYSDGFTLGYELPGSLVNGALLDGGPNALISHTLGNSNVAGRYDFQVREGQVTVPESVPEPATIFLFALAAACLLRPILRRSY
jgi:hypothetical protein